MPPPSRAMQTPSKACRRSRVPSTTFTHTFRLSPGPNSGMFLPPPTAALSWASSFSLTFILRPLQPSLRRSHRPSCSIFSLRSLCPAEISLPQVRTPFPRQFLGHFAPPRAHPAMVPRSQDLRNSMSFPDLRPRIMRIFEEILLEALFRQRLGIPDHTRQEPHHRVHQRHRGDLPA